MLIMARPEILGFNGDYRFLSNFWRCHVEFCGQIYPSVEHAYVAAKTQDPLQREKIKLNSSAANVKKCGRSFNLPQNWADTKTELMLNLVYDKFSRNPQLTRALRQTGDAYLEETNHWGDTFWGVCAGVGENMLGQILMTVRDNVE